MHALRRPWFVFALMLGGCPSNADVDKAPSASTSTPKPTTAEPATPEPVKPVQRPALPSMDTAPAVPAVKVVAASAECPSLPALEPSAPDSQRNLVPVLSLLRSISCRPELFGKSQQEVVAALSVPDGLVLEIGRRYAHVELAEPVLISDVLAVAGVAGAKLRLQQGWAPSWVVVDASGELAPRPWGTAQLDIRLAAPEQDDGQHGSLSELTADMRVQGRLGVSIDAATLAFEPDAFAASSIITALDAIAEQPDLLNDASKAHAVLDSLGERYSVSLYSVGMGEEKRTGFSLRPHRTELLASELATNLPIPDARHVEIPITDANRNRLASGEATPFIWRGLELEIELDSREGSHVGLSAWVVDELLVLPAPTKAPR